MTYRFSEQPTPGGHTCGEATSAMQKEIRRGRDREALYWATELALAGFGNYVWKRLRIIASEDVGLGEQMMAVLVRTLYENWEQQRKHDKGDEATANLFLVHAVLALARAPKTRIVDHAYVVVVQGPRPRLEVPDYALDMHTKQGRNLKRGAGHFYAEAAPVSPAAKIDDPFEDEARAIDEQLERRSSPAG
jgi:replication-associated recombination protein RarA